MPPAPAAARRKAKNSSATIRIVGPKPTSSCTRNEGFSSTGLALTSTCCLSSSCNSASSEEKAGWTVSKRVLLLPSKVTLVLKLPWITSPRDETSLTLSFWTWARNVE